ncbi:hypothetical protein [Pedobacter deserti]|uniref:hypothetical protein n=1 Tax=Pedobacter deserti TaxID=2817382 RepID=UPI00210CFA02|nr:hypothetical protein [Pedobacter sp. SYSU D00382]
MAKIDLLEDCKLKAHNVQTALRSVIFDEFENPYLLENYLECLRESQLVVERRLAAISVRDNNIEK